MLTPQSGVMLTASGPQPSAPHTLYAFQVHVKHDPSWSHYYAVLYCPACVLQTYGVNAAAWWGYQFRTPFKTGECCWCSHTALPRPDLYLLPSCCACSLLWMPQLFLLQTMNGACLPAWHPGHTSVRLC
jgi:hypothetical protein